jgi:hypothetical protein
VRFFEQPKGGAYRSHVAQQGAESANCRRMPPDDQLDDALGALIIKRNNVFIYLLNHFIDELVVILDRTLPEPKYLFLC